ncbi:TPA: hypothetical protein DCW38_01370 [candidate division WOR-3 bacterium]|jgi:hypothetical protein|uniref:Nuclear transport factor 2 family protein n=1 Tax=candidate division WOR-3 bacterium TaxID=2052148 RepID=A0A350H8F1_UNCW3|nr:hypothetical protein [candidate division WOR-3 bacterium]
MRKKLLFVLMFLAVILAGCAENSEEQSIKNAIISNMDAMNKEDAAQYMSTIYNDGSGLYESTENLIATLFEGYDLESEILSIEVLEITDNTAKIKVKTKTIRKSGGVFKDNEATMIHYMFKEGSVWKIQNSTIENINYID